MVDTSHAGSQVLDSLHGNTLPVNGDRLARYLETYTYDEADNIRTMSRKSADAATADWTRTFCYEDKGSNKLSWTSLGKSDDAAERYEYDAAGCIISISGYSNLEWDSFHRLRSSSRQKLNNGIPETTYFVYNHAGERMRKVTERASTTPNVTPTMLKESLYLPMCELTRAFMGDGATQKHEIRTSHVMEQPGSKSPLVLIELEPARSKTELVRYSLSPGLEVDDKAQVVSYEEYSPFGMTTLRACGRDVEAPSSFRFAAYRRDTETGLYYCKARYYAPWLGRWTAPDPLGTADGLNLFVYCGNDPINYTDPKGTQSREYEVVPIQGDQDVQPTGRWRQVGSFIKEGGLLFVKGMAKVVIAAGFNAIANWQISKAPPEEVLSASFKWYSAAGTAVAASDSIIDFAFEKLTHRPTEIENKVGKLETAQQELQEKQAEITTKVSANQDLADQIQEFPTKIDNAVSDLKSDVKVSVDQLWTQLCRLQNSVTKLERDSARDSERIGMLERENSALKPTTSSKEPDDGLPQGEEHPPPNYIEATTRQPGALRRSTSF